MIASVGKPLLGERSDAEGEELNVWYEVLVANDNVVVIGAAMEVV